MIELERTFLVKKLPDLSKAKNVEMIDIYIPQEAIHPIVRIRKIGDKYEITKKNPTENDFSVQKEQTVVLTKEEFDVLSSLDGKRIEKIRYILEVENRTCEIDVFKGPLKGLILADFEFETEDEKKSFQMPDFCLVDVTQERFVAGGMLAGKSYADIEADLKGFGYEKTDE